METIGDGARAINLLATPVAVAGSLVGGYSALLGSCSMA